jgi:hypothetical protein
MGPTVGKEKDARLDAECVDYALCSDVLDLGWTAVTPCRGCVIAAAATGLDRAATGDPTTASPALIVTGDELERLLCRARQGQMNGRTS